MQKLIKNKILGVRLSSEEWKYLCDQKAKGISYNLSIRLLIIEKLKIEIPF